MSPQSWVFERSWVFDRVPMAANRLNRHWRTRYQEKKAWSTYIRALARRGPFAPAIGKQPGCAARVRLGVIVHRSRPQDRDNQFASLKPFLDALKGAGWLVDDSPRWLDLHVWEKKSRRDEARTEVVWELDTRGLAPVPIERLRRIEELARAWRRTIPDHEVPALLQPARALIEEIDRR